MMLSDVSTAELRGTKAWIRLSWSLFVYHRDHISTLDWTASRVLRQVTRLLFTVNTCKSSPTTQTMQTRLRFAAYSGNVLLLTFVSLQSVSVNVNARNVRKL